MIAREVIKKLEELKAYCTDDGTFNAKDAEALDMAIERLKMFVMCAECERCREAIIPTTGNIGHYCRYNKMFMGKHLTGGCTWGRRDEK